MAYEQNAPSCDPSRQLKPHASTSSIQKYSVYTEIQCILPNTVYFTNKLKEQKHQNQMSKPLYIVNLIGLATLKVT